MQDFDYAITGSARSGHILAAKLSDHSRDRMPIRPEGIRRRFRRSRLGG